MRARILPAVARVASEGGPIPALPEYPPPEPFPLSVPDSALEPYTRRFEDLAAYYGAEQARLGQFLSSVDRASAEVAYPLALGPAPRPVPLTYVFAEAARGYWLVLRWALFPPILMVCGLAFAAASQVHPVLAALPLLPVAGYASVRAARRIDLLRRGEVADILSRTVAMGTGSMKNWPMTFTRGWHTEVRAYSGRSRITGLQYRTSRGVFGRAEVSGVEYHGVLLCDPERPDVALAVPDFGSMPRPTPRGTWDGSLPTRVWLSSILGVLLVGAWLLGVLALLLFT